MSDPTRCDLYPFLAPGARASGSPRVDSRPSTAGPLDTEPLAGGLLESIRQKTQHGRDVSRAFFADNERELVAAACALAAVFCRGGRMLAMGNGGSSCDAAHFAVEFLHPITTGRPSLPVLNLAMDTAMLSAVGNDVGMRHVFRRQVEVHARAGDGLIGFSTSGNSENLLAAYEKARQLGLVTFGLAGADGGAMRASGLVDHLLVVATDSVHRVQEVHLITYHLLWDLTHTLLADTRGPAAMRGAT
ncbi:MAG TPA: SIS domain-containing protein [Polyangiaceae bacterium]|nr:SIS domain-containing protein [Polyangiaceae bacterium]